MQQHHETSTGMYEQIKEEIKHARWEAFEFGYIAASYNREGAPEFIDNILRDNQHKDFAVAGIYAYINKLDKFEVFNKTLEAITK